MDYEAQLKGVFCNGTISKSTNSLNIHNASTVIFAFSAVKAPKYDFSMSYECKGLFLGIHLTNGHTICSI